TSLSAVDWFWPRRTVLRWCVLSNGWTSICTCVSQTESGRSSSLATRAGGVGGPARSGDPCARTGRASDSDIGVKLVRPAFGGNGPLADRSLDGGERDAISALFADRCRCRTVELVG